MSLKDKIARVLNGNDWNDEDTRFRQHHASRGYQHDYDKARNAYQYGYGAARLDDYRGRKFEEVEPDLSRSWAADYGSTHGDWNTNRGYVADAWQRGQEAVITRSEEELAIGKRTVEAGSVGVRKTVETEHVTERVPVTREEVTVERRPVNEVRAGNVEIGEQNIRVPLHQEDVVVDKRAVVKEEIVVRKNAVQETEHVEADLRRERVDIDDRTRRDATRDLNRDSELRDR